MDENQQNNSQQSTNQTNNNFNFNSQNQNEQNNSDYYRQQGEQIRQLVGEVGKIAGAFAGETVKNVSLHLGATMNEVANQLQKEFSEAKRKNDIETEIRAAKDRAKQEIYKARAKVKKGLDGYGYNYDDNYGTASPYPKQRFRNRTYSNQAIAGGLMAGFGGFCSFCFFIAAIALLLTANIILAVIMFCVMGMFSAFAISGKKKLKRNKRYRAFMEIIGDRNMCEIAELAYTIGKSEATVRKDIKKMIEIGYFDNAYMDRQRSCIFLDKAAYDAYINGFGMKNPEADIAETKKEAQQDPNVEFVQMLQEGRQFIVDMSKMRNSINNEGISAKIIKLEQTSTKILKYIEEHPQKAGEIRKFMRYYLPTTLKLLTTYREMELQNISGETIETTMREIDSVLTTIDTAFITLLDNMFKQDAMDIAAEISVMNNLMSQEGLAESDFDRVNAQTKTPSEYQDAPSLTLDTSLDTTIAGIDATLAVSEDDGEIQLKL